MSPSVLRILALETSGTAGSVAVLEGDRSLAQFELDPARRSAQTLAAGIDRVLREVGWKSCEIEMVAVAVGPGSFTGLRVGVTSAKVFAFAVNAKVIGIDTLDAIAEPLVDHLPAEIDRLAVGIDAQRGDVFAAHFVRESSTWQRERATEIVSQAAWLEGFGSRCAVAGPVLNKLVERIPAGVLIAPRESWMAQATAVGRLAARRAAAGEFDDVWKLAPLYLRRSAAEEKAGMEPLPS